jgi:hypothetical protein
MEGKQMSQEANISVTVKTNNGSLVTVRADEPEEFTDRLDRVELSGMNYAVFALESLMRDATGPAAVEIVKALGGEVIGSEFAPVPPPMAGAAAAGQQHCAHGVMTMRRGNSAKGEWRGAFCPTPKGTEGQCAPVFFKRGSGEWNNA